jgi:ribosomal-protein-alanine N-acetyltransferase
MTIYLFQDLPTLETPRLILRKLTMDDAQDQFEYAVDRELAHLGLWQPFETLQDSIDDIEDLLEGYRTGTAFEWGVEHRADRRMIGRLGLGQYHAMDKRADLGYAYNRNYWGKGYATEAAKAVLKFGFETMGLYRVGAVALYDNHASHHVLEKLGMQREGIRRGATAIRGRHEDLVCYSILRPEWEAQSKS